MEKATRSILKTARGLAREKKVRDKTGLFIAEGRKIVSDILKKGHNAEHIIVSGTFLDEPSNLNLLDDINNRGVPVYTSSGRDFDNISTLTNSQGILAVLDKNILSGKIQQEETSAPIILCDGIQDPGNIGNIIRISTAFNASGIILANNCADIFNPKVVRASSGMILDIPIAIFTLDDLISMKSDGFLFFISSVKNFGCLPVTDIDCEKNKSILVFGSEGHGVSAEVFDMADEYFHIPINEKAESLNVTSAVAITLYELTGRG